jgi:hypothetical protein
VSKVSAAINMGTAIEVPSLASFVMEMEFQKRLGLTREDLLNRPAKEIEDYCFFISMLQRKEHSDQEKQKHKGSGPNNRG